MSEILKRVEELLKLPQELCNSCGKCCKMATFKGGLTYDEVLALSKKHPTDEIDAIQVDGAKDFLTVFKPFPTMDDARKMSDEFVDGTLAQFGKKENELTFFTCRYVSEEGRCIIHEDRPHFCRMYPTPHEKTFFNSTCGFKDRALANWAEIKEILEQLEELSKPADLGANDGNH